MASTKLLRLCLDVLHYSGLGALYSGSTRGRGVILCLHQVFPGGGSAAGFRPNYQLELDTAFLDASLTLLEERGYRFLSLGDAVTELVHGAASPRPFAVVTLDDGYRDNMIQAAPVFRRHNCPYAVFVAPSIVEGTSELWWLALERVLASAEAVTVDVGGGPGILELGDHGKKNRAYMTLFRYLKQIGEYDQRIWIRKLCDQHGIDVLEPARELAMRWDELRELSRDPLCTIGAHTMNHYALARLDEADCFRELSQSKQIIEQNLGRPVDFFAYPYGDPPAAGPRDFLLAQRAGYRASITTRKGVIFDEHRDHLQALPRLMMSGRFQNLRHFEVLANGLPFALLNGFRKINVG